MTLNKLSADDGMGQNMFRYARADSIGGESSHYGGMSEIDTSKYLREHPGQAGYNQTPNSGQNGGLSGNGTGTELHKQSSIFRA